MKKIILACLFFALSFGLCSCKSSDYKDAVSQYEAGQYQQAKELFIALGEYKDSVEFIDRCSYQDAISQYEAGQYQQAKKVFIELGEYEDSSEYVKKCSYGYAMSLYQNKEYENAIVAFTELGDWSDSKEQIVACHESIKERDYNSAIDLLENGEATKAREIFLTMEDYKDSVYFLGICLYKEEKYEEAWKYFGQVPADSKYKEDAQKKEEESYTVLTYETAREYCLAHDWAMARRYLLGIQGYANVDELLEIVTQVANDAIEGVYACGDTYIAVQYKLYFDYAEGSYEVIYQDETAETIYINCYMKAGKLIVYDNKDRLFGKPYEHSIDNAQYQLVPLFSGYGFRWDLAKITLQKTPAGIRETKLEEEYIGTYGDRTNQKTQTTTRDFTSYDCIIKKI